MATNISISDYLKIRREDVQLHDLIGIGSFGAVYKGLWIRTGLIVAIKQVRVQGSESLADLCRELTTMASLSSPFICKVHGGVAVSETEIWILLDYFPEGNLHEFVHSSSHTLNWDAQFSIALYAALAVNYLHTCTPPILHRDIKSHNFLVKNGTELVLTDFGLAKTKEAITKRTATIGTLNWAAPEILKEEPKWTEKADIYSLGMVFYEIIAREIPFKSDTNLFKLHKKIKNGILPEIPRDCPKKFAEIIQLCWQKNPAQRPTSSELLELLRNVESATISPPISPNVIRRPTSTEPTKPVARFFNKLSATIRTNYSSPLPKSPSVENFKAPAASMKRSGSAPSFAELLPRTPSPPIEQPKSPSQPTLPLCKAAAIGDVATIQKLVAMGVNVEIQQEFGRTPLHLASEFGHAHAAAELIKLGHANLNVTDEFGETPLQLACERGHVETVRVLIKLGADVDGKGDVMRTPLHSAAEEGRTECVRELLRSGAQIDSLDDSENSALHWAAEGGHTETVHELLQSRANVRIKNHIGLTPLHLAAKKGHTITVKELVKFGAPVNALCSYSGTPLHLAALGGHTDTVKELILVGADVEPVNGIGKTPMQLALAKGHSEVVAELQRLTAIFGSKLGSPRRETYKSGNG